MNDRELLELAAKAARYKVAFWPDGTCGFIHAIDGGTWNPLKDDGDALRLAVDLGLHLTLPKYKGFGTTADHQENGIAGCTSFRDDAMEQTREAIVRAAAEKGKSMP